MMPHNDHEHRVVLYVFDGLMEQQADDPAVMPRLAQFRAKAARCRTHRPIFPCVTRGNAAAIATGAFPGAHGMHANMLLLRDLSSTEATEANFDSLKALHGVTGHALLAPSLGSMLAEHGLQYWGLGSWTNGCAAMHHPPDDAVDGSTGATLHPEFSLPSSANEVAIARFGPWPTAAPYPSEEDFNNGCIQMQHALKIAMEWIIPEVDPAVLCLWTCEQDHVQHYSGLGSENTDTTGILGRADAQFGEFLDWLEATGRDKTTNVLALSDHGHFTIEQPPQRLQKNGMAGVDAISVAPLLEGALGLAAPAVVVAENAGGVMLYLQDAADIERVAAWLMSQEYVGPVLATEGRGVPIPDGCLPLHVLGMQGPRAPDLAFSFAWGSKMNQWGQAGFNFSAGKVNLAGGMAGLGTHGSLSPFDMRACLAASGPAFLSDVDVTHATGHPDVVPTVLAALGLNPRPASVQGRPILAALQPDLAAQAVAMSADAEAAVGEMIETTYEVERSLPNGHHYSQRMVIGYEQGGPRVGRLVSAEFSHRTAAEVGREEGRSSTLAVAESGVGSKL